MSYNRNRVSMGLLGVIAIALLPGLVEAGSVRGHRGSGHSHRGSHSSWYYGPTYAYSYGYAYGYSPFYSGFGYYAGYPGAYYGPGYAPEVAYIDTDIQPEETAIYLDGELVGTVDDFDGFPRYLSVTPGKHQLTFKAEGRSSVTRSVRVPRGALVQLDFTLPKLGDTGGKSATKMDDEIIIPDPPGQEDAEARIEMKPDAEDGAEQEASGPGFVRVQITPGDASVYLDGELLGSAARLSGLHGAMRIEAGVHNIEVVRPGYRPGSKRILVGEGERLTVEIDLVKEVASPDPIK